MLTFDDDSFNASLRLLHQKEADELKQKGAIFGCDQSAPPANIENATDSDGDATYEYSPVRKAAKTLTNDDLRNFDDEMRRAEC